MPKKRISIFCTVCKKWIENTTEKEFRDFGHYQEGPKHLLPPDQGRSTRRHASAVRRDTARKIKTAELKAEHEARAAALATVIDEEA